eukprot:TRINITY_DN2703_c0_g1_i1.p1 TRINITY_DN2703_c0_g1~~TRINITY_DN2703_c0_g1_i1.p1  ORF type:complete len:606 (+),score=171.54 TRINITY_DN2703_c0_g1_i1:249-1820(+)
MSLALGDEYCAMRQDMRGTGTSGPLWGHKDMNFTLWHAESNDTQDTLEWIAQQDWSNGDVYQMGVSSDGLASFMTIKADPIPKQLKGQFIMYASSDAHGFAFPGGAFRESLQVGWLRGVFPEQGKGLVALSKANEAPGAWWDPVNITTETCGKVDFPSVMWAGWYDIFLQGNLHGFECFNKHSQEAVRGKSHLVVEPCGHCLVWGCPNVRFAERTLPLLLAYDLFKGNDMPADIKTITFYVMTAKTKTENVTGGFWTTVDEWPKFTPTKYYFTPQGDLTTAKPQQAAAMSYDFDPATPVPTKGGNNLMWRCGALDQQKVEDRPDVLSFTTAVLEDDVAVTGPLVVTAHVSSNMTDTDFTAKITDVDPSGQSSLIQDGIIRMRWRKGVFASTQPSLLTPGQVYEVDINLWNTSYVFNKGHKIRVSISSSNSPRFGVNDNNGLPLTQSGPKNVARNTLHVGGATPSHITLPLINLSDLKPLDVGSVVDRWYTDRPSVSRSAIESMLDSELKALEAVFSMEAGHTN